MGLAEDVTSDADQLTAVKGLLDKLLTDDSEILTMISGEESDQEVTEQLSEWIEETYPDVEVEQHEGGQPIYQYFLQLNSNFILLYNSNFYFKEIGITFLC